MAIHPIYWYEELKAQWPLLLPGAILPLAIMNYITPTCKIFSLHHPSTPQKLNVSNFSKNQEVLDLVVRSGLSVAEPP